MATITCNGTTHIVPVEYAPDCAYALSLAFHADAIVDMGDCILTIPFEYTQL
jgi:hypothetical protein